MQSIRNLLRTFVHLEPLKPIYNLIYPSLLLYERQRFYSQFLQPGDLCFDIGAHIGDYAAAFLKTGARVIALEPQAESAAYLIKRHGKNRRFEVVEKAVGESEGQADFFVASNSKISSLAGDWIERCDLPATITDRRIVPVTTLDRLILQYGLPRFIKIDVEGYELETLKGLTQPVHCLSLEFHVKEISRVTLYLDYLARLGKFEANYTFGKKTTSLALADWASPGELYDKITLRSQNKIRKHGDIFVRFFL